jgi:ribonuclease D
MMGSAGAARPLEWIADPTAIVRLAEAIAAAGIVAVDTESNSFHAYFEKVCLIQLATPGSDYLVDPFAVDPAPLAAVLADRRIVTVMHAAENDVAALKRDFGIGVTNLFDTMLAAGILGWERRGLAALLETHFDIEQDKRFQKYDWSTRPLDPEAEHYARADAAWLLPLRELQLRELEASGKLPTAQAAFVGLEGIEPRERRPTLDGWRKLRDINQLTPAQRGALAALWSLRDEIAQELDRPAFKVLSESVLVYLARRAPSRRDELDRVRELPSSMTMRFGARILEAIARGGDAGEPVDSRRDGARDESADARLAALRTWRKGYAERLGLPSEAVLPIHVLRGLAQAPPADESALAASGEIPEALLRSEAPAILSALRTSARRSTRMSRNRNRAGSTRSDS